MLLVVAVPQARGASCWLMRAPGEAAIDCEPIDDDASRNEGSCNPLPANCPFSHRLPKRRQHIADAIVISAIRDQRGRLGQSKSGRPMSGLGSKSRTLGRADGPKFPRAR